MGQIQSNIGLITGIPILETVDKLMALAARPRELIVQRNERLKAEQLALAELTSLVLAVQFASDRLGAEGIFQERSVTSSDPTALSATRTGEPVEGVYQFVPIRQARNQQLISSGVASLTQPLSAGMLSFRYGGAVDRGLALEELAGGSGVRRGVFRITDRSGDSGLIDLSSARTIEDVLDAINGHLDVRVTAVVEGDAIKLIDGTGQSLSNLIVEDLGGGTTAADLGLAGINVAAAEATGQDILTLHSGTRLDRLNDGLGVGFQGEGIADLQVTFRDGSSPLEIDFGRIGQGPGFASATTTALNGINAQIELTAKTRGSEYDNITIVFVDDLAIQQGSERVVYDDSDPLNKTLTFHIDAGQTTANDVIAALTADEETGALFGAKVTTGGDGMGLVDVVDTAATSGGAEVNASLGTVLSILNQIDPARLAATISGDGDRIVLTDLTVGGGVFSITSAGGGTTAEDLGLTATAVGGVITSRRLQAGLRTVLLANLGGGAGLGALGLVELTDRSGATDTIDLGSAETLEDIIQAINGSSVGISARVNDARNGILLADTTGSVSGNLVISSADATATAENLGIAFDGVESEVDGGSLGLAVIGSATKLGSLNGGEGVFAGSFQIIDSNLAVGVVKLNEPGAEITTVGGLIDAINALPISVVARINDAGDGILLEDVGGGTQTLEVKDLAGGTTAADLNLAGKAEGQIKDGTFNFQVEIAAGETLTAVAERINALDGGFRASVLTDGSSIAPYRLVLTNELSGSAHSLLVDSSQAPLAFQESVRGEDALLVLGSGSGPGGGILISSPTNEFRDVIPGVLLNIVSGSTAPVTVAVETTDESLVSAVQGLVDAYNTLQEKIDEVTFFNEEEKTTGVLFGSGEALRLETELAGLVTRRFTGAGPLSSLALIGITVNDQGKLSLDSEKLIDRFAADPEGVTRLLSDDEFGVASRFRKQIERLAGEDHSLLVTRAAVLADKVKTNNERITQQDGRLERQRIRLLEEFFRIEETVARLQGSLAAIQSIQALPPLVAPPA
jgi:flagellar hook-associated protein 2